MRLPSVASCVAHCSARAVALVNVRSVMCVGVHRASVRAFAASQQGAPLDTLVLNSCDLDGLQQMDREHPEPAPVLQTLEEIMITSNTRSGISSSPGDFILFVNFILERVLLNGC